MLTKVSWFKDKTRSFNSFRIGYDSNYWESTGQGDFILFRIFWSRLKLQRKINRIRTKTVFFFLPFLTGADTFDWLKPYFVVPDGVGYAELQEKMHTNGLSWTVLIQSHTYTANQVVEILSVRKFWFKTHIWIFW